jgi:GrpB-like predicted nucleotidyltransferase (UPF0157 family)
MSELQPNDNVVIVSYDPRWPAVYEQEKARVLEALGRDVIDIEHIGSTAVPGLSAKPVIDILAGVAKLTPAPEYSRRLEPLGYQHVSHADDAIRIFFRKGMPRTHHLHIVEYNSWEYWRHILFRDYLRDHPGTAWEYERLKLNLAGRYAAERATYTECKSSFIRSVIGVAAEQSRSPSIRKARQGLGANKEQDAHQQAGSGAEEYTA